MAAGHPDDALLFEWIMGSLTPVETDGVGRHCSVCASCRERVDTLRSLADGLSLLRDAEQELEPRPELWAQLSERAWPLLADSRRKAGRSAGGRPSPPWPFRWRGIWAAAASILLLACLGAGGFALWLNLEAPAAAAIIETAGPVRIVRPGQPPRQCGRKKESLRPGDVLSTPEADAAIRLDDATSLALRQGCRLEVHRPDQQRPTFALRQGAVCVDTTRARRGVCIKTPSGTVKCCKGKAVVQVTSPRCCKATALQGEAEVESGGNVTVISPGVCAELKRTRPCCRPAHPKEIRCDWANQCGKPPEAERSKR